MTEDPSTASAPARSATTEETRTTGATTDPDPPSEVEARAATADAAFIPHGDALMPTPKAASAWGPDVLHGGPVAAMVARAAERALPPSEEFGPPEAPAPDPALLPSRLTVDLFRAVPRAPLRTDVELIRQGRRVVVARVSVLAGTGSDTLEVTRGQVLFLRRTDGPTTKQTPPPPGPDGLETFLGLSRGAPLPPNRHGGYHTLVETRWPSGVSTDGAPSQLAGTPFEAQPPGSLVWVRPPFPVVEGEQPTPFQRLAAVSDFGNALANYAADWHDPDQRRSASYINTDISVSLLRPPEGEWLALVADRSTHANGVGLVEVTHHDHRGPYARGTQARLANDR